MPKTSKITCLAAKAMACFQDLLSKADLKRLKRATKKERARLVVQKNDEKAADAALFLQTMQQQGVKARRANDNCAFIQKTQKLDPNAAQRRQAAMGQTRAYAPSLSDTQALLNPVDPDARLSHKSATLPNGVFERLRQGRLRPFAHVDLHGKSVDAARDALVDLLALALEEGETVVKITHGKGPDALLKTCVNGWLRQIPEVLGFVSAPDKDGGSGAVLVLLKKTSPT